MGEKVVDLNSTVGLDDLGNIPYEMVFCTWSSTANIRAENWFLTYRVNKYN